MAFLEDQLGWAELVVRLKGMDEMMAGIWTEVNKSWRYLSSSIHFYFFKQWITIRVISKTKQCVKQMS